jgi:hypothetical protein
MRLVEFDHRPFTNFIGALSVGKACVAQVLTGGKISPGAGYHHDNDIVVFPGRMEFSGKGRPLFRIEGILFFRTIQG